MSYVFRFPQVIADIIQIYTLSYGTNVCKIFRAVFKHIPDSTHNPDYITCWRLFVVLHGRVKCGDYPYHYCISAIELQIARLQSPTINISSNHKEQLIEHANEFLKLRFKSKYYMLTNTPNIGTPTALIIKKNKHRNLLL
jgi:hypothetical protein